LAGNAAHPPGSKVTLKALRDRKELSIDATIGELKDESSAEEATPSSGGGGTATPSLGVSIADRPAGVTVVQVKPDIVAQGQLQDDVIREVNREPVRDTADAVRRLERTPRGQPILLKVHRGEHDLFVGIERSRGGRRRSEPRICNHTTRVV
jgi:S1-C subfamily serine protease